MKKNGYTVMELLVVLIVLGVVTLGVLTTTSNAFKDNSKDLYKEKTTLIEHQAVMYGKTLESLKEEGSLMITVSDLIEKEYLVADDSNGNVVDPRNSKATLNGLKIKLSYNDGNIVAEVVNE